jgi:sugar lactone lactonase YvrE/endonuclease/exonuclease/phosphatase family metal-dependent hydrolase
MNTTARLLIVAILSTVNLQSLAAESLQPLKIITHNVWYGFTKKPEPRHENWLKWMASQSPDVVSLQELNGYTSAKLASDALAWGHTYSVLLKEDGFPTGITSRYPITDVKRIREGMHHGLLRCRIRGIWFYVVHFHPSDFARRVEEAAHLQADIASLQDVEPKIVLAGDFNGFSPADREHYKRDTQLIDFFRLLDDRDKSRNLNFGKLDYGGLEAVLSQGFVDLVASYRDRNADFIGTFPSHLVNDENHGTDRRLDYIFVSANLISAVASAAIVRNEQTELLSDHIPVTATLMVEPPAIFRGQPKLLQEFGAGEGPAWHPQLGLLTSGEGNINVRSRSGESSVYREQAGSNGLMFDRQGRLVVCEPVRRRVTRLERDGSTTVLAATFEGKPFNQPNDLTMDSHHRIYFSDPCYGDRTAMELLDSAGRKVEGVYRIDLDGRVTRVIAHEVDRPNGLVVTSDDKYLFVADNNNSEGGARKLYRFELRPDGSVDLGSRRLIYDWGTTRGPDGMKLDAHGRLYVAAGLNHPNLPHESADPPTAGIYVFSAEGNLLDFVPIPRDETTNCGFGGDDMKTLFVTAGGSLWSIQTEVPGAPVWPAAQSRAK